MAVGGGVRQTERALDVTLGSTFRAVVTVVAGALTLGAVVAATVGQVLGVEDGVPAAARWIGVALMATLGLVVTRAKFVDPSREALDRAIVEAYSLTLVLLGAAFQSILSPTTIIMLFLLLMVMFTSLFSRGTITAVALALAVTSNVVGATRAPEPDWVGTVGFVAIAAVSAVIGRTAGRGFREALLTQLVARQASQQHGTKLRRVADAARDVQVLDPDDVFAAVAAATADIGWSACHLQVSLEPVGMDGVVALPVMSGPTAPEGLATHDGVVGETLWSDGVERHTLAAPVRVRGHHVGALVVGRHAHPVEDVDVQLVELLAGQVGRGLELAADFEGQRLIVAELERVGALKRDFLATVSHELRTPLHVVLGMAATLDERWEAMGAELRRHMVTRLRSNAGGLEHVIESLLDFSRLEAGAVDPARRATAVLPLVERVVQRLEHMLQDHQLTVDADDEPTDGPVFGDPNLLERVIENLVSNAARHTPAGTTIQIRVAQTGDRTLVEVADDGPGIRQQDQEQIGQRFFRGGDPLLRASRGIGLGLAFCVEVLELHDAELDVVSVPGEGTSFRFAIARDDASVSA